MGIGLGAPKAAPVEAAATAPARNARLVGICLCPNANTGICLFWMATLTRRSFLYSAAVPALAQGNAWPPAAYGATPSRRQMLWHEHDLYAFLHFTINTFTDKEWG